MRPPLQPKAARRARRTPAEISRTIARASLVSSAILAMTLVACGPPQGPQKPEGETSGPTPSDTAVVVPIAEPDPTSTASVDAPPDPDPIKPSRPLTAAGPLEPCIARLRDEADLPDPTKATGSSEYHSGLAAERSGSRDVARRTYLGVIQKYPDSTLIAATYFAFGEMFFDDARTDPSKFMLAQQAYRETLKYPGSRLAAVTRYRLGLTLSGSKNQEALAEFMKAIQASSSASKEGCAAEVSAMALEGSLDMFADVGSASQAWAFYLKITGDGARAADAVLRLADRYSAAKKGADARDCLVAAAGPGHKAQPDAAAKKAYCLRLQTSAASARATGGAGATLDQAVQSVCP